METDVIHLIECPECGAVVGDERTSGHLRWMYCGNCEASWRAPGDGRRLASRAASVGERVPEPVCAD